MKVRQRMRRANSRLGWPGFLFSPPFPAFSPFSPVFMLAVRLTRFFHVWVNRPRLAFSAARRTYVIALVEVSHNA